MNELVKAIADEYTNAIAMKYQISKPADIEELRDLYGRLFKFEMKKTYREFIKDYDMDIQKHYYHLFNFLQ